MKQKKYLFAIGLTVFVAIILVTRSLLFLHPSPGDGATTIRVHFQNVDKISPGTRVTFAGKPIGEVKQVTLLSEQAFSCRTHRTVYPYEVTLAIDSSVTVYKTDVISVKTAGLMGERFIAITPRPTPEGTSLVPVTPNMVLFAASSGNAEEAFEDLQSVAKQAEMTMQSLNDMINKNQESMYDATIAVKNAANQLELLLATLNNDGFSERLALLTTKSIALVDTLNTLSSPLKNGEGSLGKLLRDPSLYDNMQACTRNMNQFISDMNQYGLLFHTNRDWQRAMLVRKENQSAKTPAELTKAQFCIANAALEDLRTTLNHVTESLDHGSVTKDEALRHELVQNYEQLQLQLSQLHSAMSQVGLTRGSHD